MVRPGAQRRFGNGNAMARQYWLIKSEPAAYSYAQLENDGRTAWTGVRNFEARNNIRSMKRGDLALFYHSGEGKEIVGVARVASAPGPDATAPKEDWSSVDMEPVAALAKPVPLAEAKKSARLQGFQLLTRSRLSVVSVSPQHFGEVLRMGKTKI
jgi:predicted RNA-binding protein with PUA-like domain